MNICLSDFYYQTFSRTHKKEPRERYTQYVTDLYKMYQNTVTPPTFIEGDQLTYAEMGNEILKSIFTHYDPKLFDLIVISYWTHEFDPDFVACGPYFAEEFGIKGAIFDVSDQGSIAPFTAVHVIKQYLQNPDYKKAILLTFEQTTIPRNVSEFNLIPTLSASAAIVLDKSSNKSNSYQLLTSETLNERQILANDFNIFTFIKSEAEKFSLSLKNITLVIKKGSFGWKSLQYFSRQFSETLSQIAIQFYDYRPSCLTPIEFLYNNLEAQHSRHYYLILAEDIESLNYGYLLIKRGFKNDIY